jgi:hypothetical protein
MQRHILNQRHEPESNLDEFLYTTIQSEFWLYRQEARIRLPPMGMTKNQSRLADCMGFAVFALERVLVIHVGTLPGLDMSLLRVLVVLEPSGNSLLVLGVKEVTDLLDITNHCNLTLNIRILLTESLKNEFDLQAAARDREKSIRQTIRNSLRPSAWGAILYEE